jgi:hypothetical protein
MSAAFTTLLLAHLIADYPLQTEWMVKAKRTWPGLCAHVAIHLAVLLLVCLPHTAELWPFLLALAVAHLAMDAFKNFLARRRPQWVNGPYLFDQLLHFLSIWAIAAWAPTILPGGWPIERSWQIYLIAFLLVTIVCYISERVLHHANPAYQRELIAQRWTRMGARAILLALLVWLGGVTILCGSTATKVAPLPYFSGVYGRRALLTDLFVTGAVAAMLWLNTT